MDQEQKTSNLGKMFLIIFTVIATPTFLIYKLLGFEIGILFCISVSTAIISMAFAGLENTIINKK